MTEQENLYETLGELLYAVAMADGVIQPEEKTALAELLKHHSWADQINWSFNYENRKATSVEAAYEKAINFCKFYGPSAHYETFIEAMTTIAEAADGVHQKEDHIIQSFSKDLIAKFQRDFDK